MLVLLSSWGAALGVEVPELSRAGLSSLMVTHAQSSQDAGIVEWTAQQADTEVKNPLLRTIISLSGMSDKGHVNKACCVPPFCQEIPAAGWHLGSGESCVPPTGSWREQAQQCCPFTPQQSCTGLWGHSRLTPPCDHTGHPIIWISWAARYWYPRPCNRKML